MDVVILRLIVTAVFTVGAMVVGARLRDHFYRARLQSEILHYPVIVPVRATATPESVLVATHGTLLGISTGIVKTDNTLEQYLGLEPNTLLGTAWTQYIHPDDLERCLVDSSRTSGLTAGVYRYRHVDEYWLHVQFSWAWIKIGDEWCSFCTWVDYQAAAARQKAYELAEELALDDLDNSNGS